MLIIGMLPCYRSICQVVSKFTLMPATTYKLWQYLSMQTQKPTFQQTQSFQGHVKLACRVFDVRKS